MSAVTTGLIAGTPRGNHVWLTTHAKELAEGAAKRTGTEPVRLTRGKGETRIVGQGLIDLEEGEE